ncbi:hypothetical protein BDV25DRAFT_138851 [Aspergillus avenaceus]|uniref:Uncharacterized protein n=1 Tax=Aspergillus avenaceus TaxID=36643 RepID=A0A5N6TZE0_ASPAV|nr:hypothetical protein BDV25DRAFT_138851 [Aspergillus avenaceus]
MPIFIQNVLIVFALVMHINGILASPYLGLSPTHLPGEDEFPSEGYQVIGFANVPMEHAVEWMEHGPTMWEQPTRWDLSMVGHGLYLTFKPRRGLPVPYPELSCAFAANSSEFEGIPKVYLPPLYQPNDTDVYLQTRPFEYDHGMEQDRERYIVEEIGLTHGYEVAIRVFTLTGNFIFMLPHPIGK